MAVTIITYFCPITSSFSPPRFPSGFSYSSQGLSSNLSPHFFTPRLLPTSGYLISLPPASLSPVPPTPCPFFHVIPLHKKQWFPTCSHPNSYPCPSNPAPFSTQSQHLLPKFIQTHIECLQAPDLWRWARHCCSQWGYVVYKKKQMSNKSIPKRRDKAQAAGTQT